MKYTIPLLTAALTLGLAGSAMAELKIGTVNVKNVFSNYYKTKNADSKMREATATVRHDMDEKSAKIKAMEDDINKDSEMLKQPEINEAKKAPIAKGLEKKINDYKLAVKDRQEFAEEKSKELDRARLLMRNGIVEDITRVISDVQKADNFDIIFDTSGFSDNAMPVIVFSKPDWDFTKDVITKLNADKPASSGVEDAAAPATSGAPAAPAATGSTPPAAPKTEKPAAPTPKKNK